MPDKKDIQGLSGCKVLTPRVASILKLSLLLFDSFGVQLCPEATLFIKNAMKGNVKDSVKLKRFCDKDIWPAA